MQKVFLTLLSVFILNGCSQNLQPTVPEDPQNSCIPALTELQQLSLSHTGLQQGEPIPAAPWLRSSRLTDYFTHQNNLSAQQLEDLLNEMSGIAATGLKIETELLPKVLRDQWLQGFAVTDADRFIEDCSQQLVTQQMQTPAETGHWLRSLPEDNDYQPLARALGLYPLTSLLFKQGVIDEHNWLYQQPAALKHADWITYIPTSTRSPTPESVPIPDATLRNSLGIPHLTSEQQQALFEYHAPLWRLPDQHPQNRPGAPYWHHNDLKVDQHPVNFTFISYGIYHSEITLQLNYLIWFPERKPESRFDLVAGQHDAVVFRVHLLPSGETLAYDSIHLCGCWYSLILPKEQEYKPRTGLYQEPTYVLRTDTGRQLVSLTSNSHLVIASEKNDQPPSELKHYQLQPLTNLLRLPTDQSARSIFNRHGFVPGSERMERWLFWPMGITNPGALRRPGDHAIRFIGHLHFDDPQILEKLGL